MEDDSINTKRFTFVEHLVELRRRLIFSISALFLGFGVCFYFADDIYNILLYPYTRIAGPDSELIFTAPQEFFFTQIKLSVFGSFFITFPVIASQLYMFIAPGLYKNERNAFLPFLLATPILFIMGALLLYFVVLPLVLSFFINTQQNSADTVKILLLPRVSEYLSLVMTLLLAFGLSFQLPVLLMLLVRVGLIDTAFLVAKRRYAIVIAFLAAAFLTPPDPISQISLALPILLLYEISILTTRFIDKKHEKHKKQ